MASIPQHVVAESRANIDEWAAEAQMLLATEPATRFAAGKIAELVAACGHPGVGHALVDAGYFLSSLTAWLTRKTGQEFSAAEAASLLGMAGLVLADREVPGG